MFLNGKKILLAGATGMAGTSVMRYILGNYPSTTIRAVYHKNTKVFYQHDRVEYVYGDLRSSEDCRRLARGCDCGIMAAGTTGGAGAMTSVPWQFVTDNLIMNANLFEAFHLEGVNRAISIGSAVVYQEYDGFIREEQLDLNQDPHHAYHGIGWVKRYMEKLGEFWHTNCGMEVINIRLSNIFGPYAKFNPKTSNFIPAIISKAVAGMDPFEVWGSPQVTRDVLYVEDFARAVAIALNNTDIKYDTFNIGSGLRTTVGEVVDWTLKHTGFSPRKVVYQEAGPSTIQLRALDCSKARHMLEWEPQFTIEQGIKMTIDWWKQNKEWWAK